LELYNINNPKIKVKMETLSELNQKEAELKTQLEEIKNKKADLANKGKITSRVKTFEDACKELGIDVSSIKQGELSKDEYAYIKLKIIAKALNEGWTPDWTNSNEWKYYPWFDLSKRASGFSSYGYNRWNTNTVAASRLCFKNSELAKFAGTQFVEIYKDYII